MALATHKSSIETLKAVIGKRGIARTNRFEVDLSGMGNLGIATADEVRDLEMLVDTASMPGKQLTTFGYNLYRQNSEFPTGYVLESFQIEFILTQDFLAKKIMDKWMKKVVPPSTYLIAYADSYRCPITVKQLSISGSNEEGITDIMYKATLTDCYPKSVQSIGYSQSSDDVGRLVVEFNYTDIETYNY